MNTKIFEKIKERIYFHAAEKKHCLEIPKGVIRYLTLALLADLRDLGAIFPPVALNSKVYIISRKRPREGEVVYIGAGADGTICFNVIFGEVSKVFTTRQYMESDIGENIFLSKEDALKAIEVEKMIQERKKQYGN